MAELFQPGKVHTFDLDRVDETEIQAILASLPTEEERTLFLQSVEQFLEDGVSESEQLLEYEEFERPMVPIAEWLNDPYYVGLIAEDLYPKWKHDLIDFFDGDHWLGIFTGALGTGKTTAAMVGFMRCAYELSCYRQPARSVGLGVNSPIYLANLSVSGKQAKRAAYSSLEGMISQSPYFREVCPPEPGIKSELRFPKRITVFPGTGDASSILGLNIFGGLVDEANLMAISTQGLAAERSIRQGRSVFDQAQTLVESMVRRAKSRFMSHGRMPVKIFVVSSRVYPGEFTERLEHDAKTDPGIFVRSYSLWDVKPDQYSDKRFKVEVATAETRSRVLTDSDGVWLEGMDPASVVGDVVGVPADFYRDFLKDPDGSLREFGGLAVGTIEESFLKLKERIFAAVDADEAEVGPRQPMSLPALIRGVGGVSRGNLLFEELCVVVDGVSRPRWHAGVPRAVHLDSGLTRDAFGLVMGCAPSMAAVRRRQPGGEESIEAAPNIWIDLMARVVPPTNSEVDFGAIRELLYQLRAWGFKISIVTMDSWQTVEMQQRLQEKGFTVEELSVDATEEPYLSLRSAFYEQRMRLYRYWMALIELTHLRRDAKKKKIDHPAFMTNELGEMLRGSKDVADGLAGVVHTLTQRGLGMHAPVAPSPGQVDVPTPVLPYGVPEYEWLLGRKAGKD